MGDTNTPITVLIVDDHALMRQGIRSYFETQQDLDPGELADAVRAAARDEAILHPRVAARVMGEMREGEGTLSPFAELTDRELDVLRLIAEKGLSNAEIAEELVVTEKTVKGYVSNILDKLHLANRTQAAIYAWQEGIVRRDR
ncbi:MAG: response regulator transcription factor, partial [Anaerolineae bacterium]